VLPPDTMQAFVELRTALVSEPIAPSHLIKANINTLCSITHICNQLKQQLT
jgi:hypothetical protein